MAAHEPGRRFERTDDVGSEPELVRQHFDGSPARGERFRPGVDLDAGDADRCKLAAHAVGCLDHRDGDAGTREIARDDQPGHPRADHDDACRLCERIGGRLR